MTFIGPDFRQTWLWRHAFQTQRPDSSTDEQEFFRTQYIFIRERVEQLVSRIAGDFPGITVHDISHLDALWDTASLVAEGSININPPEAFVFGASVLLHDAAMSLAAYPGGLVEVRETVAWKDAIARLAVLKESGKDDFDVENPPESIVGRVLPEVLRRLHAERAEGLAEQAWRAADGSEIYLIDNSDLRRFYGPTIGQIAHSHWWSVHKLEQEFSGDLGAFPNRTRNLVDKVKLSCLLRVADALHLDSRRAPRFLRAITNPTGISALHWSFQERFARPHVELDAVVFTTGQPFGREDAEAWWLAYDTLNAVDRELRDVDLLLQNRSRELLKARRVRGAGSPEILARTVQTRGWRPVDTRLQVSDVPRIVENLGGSKLYGKDPTVALRELIQNATDAIQARRKYQKRDADWGRITVNLLSKENQIWLIVEDNGIGMSEQVLTGPLLDFGMSFWQSPLALEEFPGLMAAGMHAIGRFGIGFFSVFMLGSHVRVYSRRCDKGQDTGRMLEFCGGTSTRPILSTVSGNPMPIDGGTRVEVLLNKNPINEGGLLYVTYHKRSLSLDELVGAVAPNLDVEISTVMQDTTQPVVKPGDWLLISNSELVCRLNPMCDRSKVNRKNINQALMQPIEDMNRKMFGRAFIFPLIYSFINDDNVGLVTIAGLRTARLRNVVGVLLGEAITAVRDTARPLATKEALAKWASKQAELIATTVEDEERHARSAEVVLECGGEVGNLKIIKFGIDWLTEYEFIKCLRSLSEIAVNFDGEFEYDENQDDVHPRDFRQNFEVAENIFTVIKYDGSILRSSNSNWPESILRQTKRSGSNLEELTKKLIRNAWGENFEEYTEERIVGTVHLSEITRDVTIFRIASDD